MNRAIKSTWQESFKKLTTWSWEPNFINSFRSIIVVLHKIMEIKESQDVQESLSQDNQDIKDFLLSAAKMMLSAAK